MISVSMNNPLYCVMLLYYTCFILYLAGCVQAGDVVFALDASGSIGKANFQVMTTFVTSVVQSLDIGNRRSPTSGTRIGLLTYGDNPKFEFNLNEYLDSDTELLNAINVRFTDGTTNTADAIR